ncbi:hypothetical protein RV18_GL000740 [Enterococcus termitis]|nr:hypothetical protein RV18_GL000740 [Enterococcus termitis]
MLRHLWASIEEQQKRVRLIFGSLNFFEQMKRRRYIIAEKGGFVSLVIKK